MPLKRKNDPGPLQGDEAHDAWMRSCEETLSRRLMIDVDLDVYEEIRRDAEAREITVEQSIGELLADAASGQFVMVKVATAE